MKQEIYLDNNATTKCSDEVFEAMFPYLKDTYGNPSSIYAFGKEVKDAVNKARNNVAKLLNAEDEEIIFTSCASESNITAIMNAVRSNPDKRHIITTSIEHASIIETMKYLEDSGYKITRLGVNKSGQISLEELENSICDDTCLIAVMMANNELGNVYPIREIGEIAKKYNILFHCDAVQAVGKVNIDVAEMGMDTLSLSGHKIHAPKGIGVLYVKKDTPFTPLIFGHQENNRRGGTENVPYIIGLGKAAELLLADKDGNYKLQELRDYMEEQIKEKIEDVYIYGDLENRLPNTSNIAFKGVEAQKLMLMLESFGILVSTGSACNSEIAEPSHVLVACNADLDNYSPIRISLSKYNTKDEIDTLVKSLINIVKMLRRK